jgi:hypothetical protein
VSGKSHIPIRGLESRSADFIGRSTKSLRRTLVSERLAWAHLIVENDYTCNFEQYLKPPINWEDFQALPFVRMMARLNTSCERRLLMILWLCLTTAALPGLSEAQYKGDHIPGFVGLESGSQAPPVLYVGNGV